MTHDASTPEPAVSRRRRFPLTIAAMVGSAIAVPLYIATATMGKSEAPVATAASEAAPVAPEPAAEPSGADGVHTESSVVEELPATASAAPSDAVQRHAGEEGVMGRPVPRGDAAIGDFGGGAFGLVGTGRGGGEAGGLGAGGRPAPPPSRAMKKKASVDKGIAAIARDGDGFRGRFADADADAREAEPIADDEAGYDQRIAAGQLTAGAIDDLGDAKLLDELRASVARQDAQVGQAIPEHASVGPRPGAAQAPRTLEIGLVLDTTGSMGDEIQYLKAELRSIAEEIARQYPNVTQRFALVAYKDQGDEYVVRGAGFESLDAFEDRLGAEHASGGGDFPEALDAAMQSAADLPWSDGDAAKLVFVVADAPPHATGYTPYARSTVALAGRDVSVYPVASSGVNQVSEYLMRWAARTTGGKYLFLTDHSGIGNAHAAPVVDQYELKPLRAHMLDVIHDELTVRDGSSDETLPCFTRSSAEHPAPQGWLDRHGLFVAVLGGVFLLGFSGDMARSAVRRRRIARHRI